MSRIPISNPILIDFHRYESMLVHNQRYEAGEVTWWRKVTKHYDLTMEEIERDLGLGNVPLARP